MQFIVSGQRIAVENFVTGKLYTILWKNDTEVNLMCTSIGADCVVFQGEAPLNLFTLTMQNADTIDTIEPTQLGTTNYNNLINKPSINGVDLIGNKTSAALGIRDVPAIIESDDGKILTASSDGTYTWQPAPSSGTMDYTQLNNKPQINSVTLTGNVSLADLGAAAAADIPTTPADIGAEPAITSENMLDADLVDDTSSTHKFATAAQLAQIGTNENNISTINNNLIYSPTQPTGDISDGAIWVNTAIGVLSDYIKKYHVSQNILDDSIIENGYTLDTATGLPSTYNGRVATISPINVENYDAMKITYNAAVSLMYSTFNADNELIIREINKSSGFTFNVSNAKYLYLCWYSSGNISKDDIGNIMLNAGTTAKPYEPYSAEIWHSNNT